MSGKAGDGMNNELLVLVPAGAEALLLAMCLLVWLRLRELKVNGVCQLTLAAIIVDAVVQTWQLGRQCGSPAGVPWLLHAMLSYMMVYVLYRLGEMLWARRVQA